MARTSWFLIAFGTQVLVGCADPLPQSESCDAALRTPGGVWGRGAASFWGTVRDYQDAISVTGWIGSRDGWHFIPMLPRPFRLAVTREELTVPPSRDDETAVVIKSLWLRRSSRPYVGPLGAGAFRPAPREPDRASYGPDRNLVFVEPLRMVLFEGDRPVFCSAAIVGER